MRGNMEQILILSATNIANGKKSDTNGLNTTFLNSTLSVTFLRSRDKSTTTDNLLLFQIANHGEPLLAAHPVVPGSPICGMRMPCGGRLRRTQMGIEWLASDRRVDSPARAKGP